MSRRVGVLVAVGCLGLLVGLTRESLVGAAPVPKHLMKPAPQYFPTQVGAKWVYTRLGQDETSVVTKVEVKKNEKLVTVELVEKDGTKKPWQVVSVRADGLFLVSETGAEYDPPLCLLKLPVEVGQTWETNTSRSDGIMINGKKKVAAEERLKVPAGEFQTVRIESEDVVGGLRPKIVHWHAPHVGIVRIDTDKPHVILKSFTPGKE